MLSAQIPDDIPMRMILEKALHALERLDPAPFVAMFAEDGVLEFPFSAPETPIGVRGRAAIASLMDAVTGLSVLKLVRQPRIVEDCERDTCVIEAAIKTETAAGTCQLIEQVVVVDHADGAVTRWRDYRRQTVVAS